ncbi:hypothetical protein [Nocardia colli]|uniref:hypothetical protein n=1 Tax=Nocardia colli TaxID=2545717 RepID=UPI0035D794D1
MSESELIYFETVNPPMAEAGDIARVLDGEVGFYEDDGGLCVSIPSKLGTGFIEGPVYPNIYNEERDDDWEPTAPDAYRVVFQMRGDRRVLRAEAGRIFDALMAARPTIPMILTHNLDILAASYVPGKGVKFFAENVTIDAEDEPVWREWVATPD